MKEKTLAAGDVRPKYKQMTQPGFAGVLGSFTQYDRKSKQWLRITDVVTWWKSVDLTYQAKYIFLFYYPPIFYWPLTSYC